MLVSLLAGWLVSASGQPAKPTAAVEAAVPAPEVHTTRWVFTLPRAATTSAGVYDAQGRLIRTLWRGDPMSAGRHEGAWDGRDDAGRNVAESEYKIRLVHHRLSYVWEGVIGNTSTSIGGAEIHAAYLPPTSIVIDGQRAIYAVGYNEKLPGLHSFRLAAPDKNARPFRSSDQFASFSMIAADATRLYWANTGGMSRTSFVAAFDLNSAKVAAFTSGHPACLNMQVEWNRCYEPQSYESVIDLETREANAPTGLAVQRSGRVLAVAHGPGGGVRLFDKSTGESLGEIKVPLAGKALNQIAMTPAGDLWVISGTSIQRFTDLDRRPTLAAAITGLTHPVALATDPVNDNVIWVADGGVSQQLKRFDGSGTPGEVIGRAGGYAHEPQVTGDKLCFRSREGHEQTAIGVAADETLWVVDYCNNRMLRFAVGKIASRQSDAQVAYLPASYMSTVDHANPRRVFSNFLEFDADPGVPLVPGRSWSLVRNWLAGLPASLEDSSAFNGGFGGFNTVETLANGRTYAMLQAQSRQVIVELPKSGPLRIVKVLAADLPGATRKVMYENGDLGYALTGQTKQTVMRLTLNGFDAAGDPHWASEPVALSSVPTLPGSPYHRVDYPGLPPRFPVTASGRVVYFDHAVVGNEGFHLGAALLGGNEWLWQASPTGPLDGKGSFQTKKVDGSIQYGGNAVWAQGRHIVYGYHGEFYRDLQTGNVGQANQFMHFDESGLFLGQFGQSSTRPAPPSQAGMSGNAVSPTLVLIGTRLHLFHNDESTHGGVHRWRIDGWDDVMDIEGTGPLGTTIVLH